MDLFFLLPGLFGVTFIAYQLGKMSTTAPTEEEMFRRIVQARQTRRLEKQVETALEDELSREATI